MKKKLFAVLAVLCACWSQLCADNIILTTPQYYEISAISPNGKWACGSYNDYSSTNYGFRWNLETGEIELLSTTTESGAFSVSDNGVVAGNFSDDQVGSMEMPGYWDGSWHHLEMPEGNITGGITYGGISTDGHYMSGVVELDGVYVPYIWKDGKILRRLECPYDAVTFCISPDGQSVGGWAYPDHDGKPGNRAATYWTPDGKMNILSDYESPWSVAKKFSPDGKKLLYWGGWNTNTDEWPKLAAIYDIETGRTDSISALSEAGFEVCDISNSTTVVGYLEFDGGGVVYHDGQLMPVKDYLDMRGVNLEGQGIATDTNGELAIFRAAVISADDSRIGLIYYDLEGQYRSMIVMMDENASDKVAPMNVTATQMQGINTVCLTWSKALQAADALGYNIYRDGVKVNAEPVSGMRYYDAVGEPGTYTYTVAAVYDDGEAVSDGVTVAVEAQTVSVPQVVYARQKGINGARLQWMAPATNFIGRTYVDMETANVQGFGVNTATTFETGVLFDKEDIANYKGYKVARVQFYPMDVNSTGWKLNIYTRAADSTLTRLVSQDITQTLTYNAFNTVALDTPLDLPDGELLVAVETSTPAVTGSVVGMDFAHCTTGHSDMLRQASDDDFYSLSEASYTNPFYVSWLMNVVLEPENADGNADKVDHYTVYADGTAVAETSELSYNIGTMTDGDHTLGVSATFADGRISDIATADLSIATSYKAVDNVSVSLEGETAINASWKVPATADDDATLVSYASGEASDRAPVGPSSNNYGLMASAVYTPAMLKGYNGYCIRSFRFYPTADALFSFYLYKNDEEIYTLDVDDYVLGEWNTVELPGEITVDEMCEYRLVLDCYDVTPETPPLAIDKNAAQLFYSDAYSLDGSSWASLSDTGLHGNWMLGWVMADKNGEPLTVSGYDVNIDGVKKNQAMLTDTKFSYDFGTEAAGTHSISVDTYYPSATESVKGTVTYFTIKGDPSGISDNTVETLRLRLGENYLRIEGDGVQTVTAYSLSGAKAASAQGNTLNITSLVPGVYVIKAKSADGELVRKIEIRK